MPFCFSTCRGLNKQGYKCRRECLLFLSICISVTFYPFVVNTTQLTISHHVFNLECNAAIHKKCIEKIIGRCTGTAANSRETMVSKVNVHLRPCRTCPNRSHQTICVQTASTLTTTLKAAEILCVLRYWLWGFSLMFTCPLKETHCMISQ